MKIQSGTQEGGKQFFDLKSGIGAFTQKVPEGTAGSVVREYINPQTGENKSVTEIQATNITGKVTKVYIEQPPEKFAQIGEKLCLEIDNEGVLQIKLLTGKDDLKEEVVKLVQQLVNVDFDKEVNISVATEQDGKYTRTTVFLNQDGKNVGFSFTKNSDNPMPAWEKTEKRGKVTWSKEKRDDFVYEKLQEVINKFDGGSTDTPKAVNTSDTEAEVAAADLPF